MQNPITYPRDKSVILPSENRFKKYPNPFEERGINYDYLNPSSPFRDMVIKKIHESLKKRRDFSDEDFLQEYMSRLDERIKKVVFVDWMYQFDIYEWHDERVSVFFDEYGVAQSATAAPTHEFYVKMFVTFFFKGKYHDHLSHETKRFLNKERKIKYIEEFEERSELISSNCSQSEEIKILINESRDFFIDFSQFLKTDEKTILYSYSEGKTVDQISRISHNSVSQVRSKIENLKYRILVYAAHIEFKDRSFIAKILNQSQFFKLNKRAFDYELVSKEMLSDRYKTMEIVRSFRLKERFRSRKERESETVNKKRIPISHDQIFDIGKKRIGFRIEKYSGPHPEIIFYSKSSWFDPMEIDDHEITYFFSNGYVYDHRAKRGEFLIQGFAS